MMMAPTSRDPRSDFNVESMMSKQADGSLDADDIQLFFTAWMWITVGI